MSVDRSFRQSSRVVKSCSSQACASQRKKINRQARAAHWQREGQQLGIPASMARFKSEEQTRQAVKGFSCRDSLLTLGSSGYGRGGNYYDRY